MHRNTRNLTHAALIAALYAALTYLQNLLLPGSASWAIQFRASEGLSIGCLVFNLSYAGALPLDPVLGTAATALAASAMYFIRKWTIKGFPLFALLMPALFNALLIGWELALYIGGGFWLNALYVAIGEAAVLLTLGTALFYGMKTRRLDQRLFGSNG